MKFYEEYSCEIIRLANASSMHGVNSNSINIAKYCIEITFKLVQRVIFIKYSVYDSNSPLVRVLPTHICVNS